jgi:hypothetical protein
MDAINPEDRIEIKFGDFYALVKNSTSAELMMNGIKNKIDHDSIYTMMKGEHLPEPCEITAESEDK